MAAIPATFSGATFSQDKANFRKYGLILYRVKANYYVRAAVGEKGVNVSTSEGRDIILAAVGGNVDQYHRLMRHKYTLQLPALNNLRPSEKFEEMEQELMIELPGVVSGSWPADAKEERPQSTYGQERATPADGLAMGPENTRYMNALRNKWEKTRRQARKKRIALDKISDETYTAQGSIQTWERSDASDQMAWGKLFGQVWNDEHKDANVNVQIYYYTRVDHRDDNFLDAMLNDFDQIDPDRVPAGYAKFYCFWFAPGFKGILNRFKRGGPWACSNMWYGEGDQGYELFDGDGREIDKEDGTYLTHAGEYIISRAAAFGIRMRAAGVKPLNFIRCVEYKNDDEVAGDCVRSYFRSEHAKGTFGAERCAKVLERLNEIIEDNARECAGKPKQGASIKPSQKPLLHCIATNKLNAEEYNNAEREAAKTLAIQNAAAIAVRDDIKDMSVSVAELWAALNENDIGLFAALQDASKIIDDSAKEFAGGLMCIVLHACHMWVTHGPLRTTGAEVTEGKPVREIPYSEISVTVEGVSADLDVARYNTEEILMGPGQKVKVLTKHETDKQIDAVLGMRGVFSIWDIKVCEASGTAPANYVSPEWANGSLAVERVQRLDLHESYKSKFSNPAYVFPRSDGTGEFLEYTGWDIEGGPATWYYWVEDIPLVTPLAEVLGGNSSYWLFGFQIVAFRRYVDGGIGTIKKAYVFRDSFRGTPKVEIFNNKPEFVTYVGRGVPFESAIDTIYECEDKAERIAIAAHHPESYIQRSRVVVPRRYFYQRNGMAAFRAVMAYQTLDLLTLWNEFGRPPIAFMNADCIGLVDVAPVAAGVVHRIFKTGLRYKLELKEATPQSRARQNWVYSKPVDVLMSVSVVDDFELGHGLYIGGFGGVGKSWYVRNVILPKVRAAGQTILITSATIANAMGWQKVVNAEMDKLAAGVEGVEVEPGAVWFKDLQPIIQIQSKLRKRLGWYAITREFRKYDYVVVDECSHATSHMLYQFERLKSDLAKSGHKLNIIMAGDKHQTVGKDNVCYIDTWRFNELTDHHRKMMGWHPKSRYPRAWYDTLEKLCEIGEKKGGYAAWRWISPQLKHITLAQALANPAITHHLCKTKAYGRTNLGRNGKPGRRVTINPNRLEQKGDYYTVHIAQGMTISTPYAIHEAYKMGDYRILFTALSRATDPANIYICYEQPSHTYNETIDAAALNWICEHPPADADGDAMAVARSMLAKLRKDEAGAWRLRTAYFQRAGSDKGRFTVAKRRGLQALKRSIRAAVAGAFYDDIDIVNSGACMLRRLCGRRNYATPCLDEYIADRERILGEIMRIFKLSRDEAKKGIIAIMNGGFPMWAREGQFMPWLRRFSEEIRSFAKAECARVSHAANIRKFIATREKYGKTTNHECAFVGRMVFELENEVLQFALARLKKDGHVVDDVVLCFDGLMIPKGRVDMAYLRGLEADILEEFKTDIKLTIKPFGKGVAVPPNLPPYDPDDDKNAIPYCWPPQFVRVSDGRAFNLVDLSYEDDGTSVTFVEDDEGYRDIVLECQIGKEWQLRGCGDPSLVEALICENFDWAD